MTRRGFFVGLAVAVATLLTTRISGGIARAREARPRPDDTYTIEVWDPSDPRGYRRTRAPVAVIQGFNTAVENAGRRVTVVR